MTDPELIMIRCILITICLGWWPYVALCQGVHVQAGKQQVLYQCADNPLTISAGAVKPDALVVSTDNGTISAGSRGAGAFNTRPVRPGRARILVYRKTDKDKQLIDSASFEVKPALLPQARFDGKTGGDMKAVMFRTRSGPTDNINAVGFTTNAPIRSFTVSVYREFNKIFKRSFSDPPRFDTVAHNFFKKLENGDKIVFTDMVIKLCDGTQKSLAPIEFRVTDAN